LRAAWVDEAGGSAPASAGWAAPGFPGPAAAGPGPVAGL